MTVPQFKKEFKPNLNLPRYRESFTPEQIDLVSLDERRGVVLTGYIMRAVKQGPENTNCADPDRVDVHVWVFQVSRGQGGPNRVS